MIIQKNERKMRHMDISVGSYEICCLSLLLRLNGLKEHV